MAGAGGDGGGLEGEMKAAVDEGRCVDRKAGDRGDPGGRMKGRGGGSEEKRKGGGLGGLTQKKQTHRTSPDLGGYWGGKSVEDF